MGAERQRRRGVAVAIAALATLALRAVDGSASESEHAKHNVILLLADTLRADHTSLYGYARPTTPALERRARTATVFERNRSQTACTPTSVASLLTSRYPAHFLARELGIPPHVRSLAEILRDAGYRTIALSASAVVRNTPSKVNRTGGFGRGFAVFDEECENRDARCLNERALAHLGAGEGPFFLYVHYMDVHHPYRPPDDHERRFALADLSNQPAWLRDGNPDPIGRLLHGRPEPGDAGARLDQVPYLRDLYDEEILAFDAELDRFFDELEERGLLDDSIVILAADHGEMFLEQDEIKHCRGLWDSVSRTPLVVWVPGVAGGRRVASPAENVDIVPTVVDLLGLSKSGAKGSGEDGFESFAGFASFEGQSLRGHLEGTEPANAPGLAFASQSTLRSVDDGRFKLILEIDSGNARLYDLAADPLEREDVSAKHPEERDRLRKALDAWLAKNREIVGHAETIENSGRVERKLRALGYLE